MPKTKNPNTEIRARPACARCGGTGTVAGGHVYPGTHAARWQERCLDCAPATTKPTKPTKPPNRQQRQLAQRAWCADLLFAALAARPEVTDPDVDTRTACLSYTCDGHRYLFALTITETQ